MTLCAKILENALPLSHLSLNMRKHPHPSFKYRTLEKRKLCVPKREDTFFEKKEVWIVFMPCFP